MKTINTVVEHTVAALAGGVLMLTMAFAQEPTQAQACRAICVASRDQCVNETGAFNTLRNVPDTTHGDMNTLLQSQAANKAADSDYAFELRQKCSDAFMRCAMTCTQAAH